MISAFKHIRLSGFNLLPQSSNGNVRLSLNSSGVAYFNELSTASGVLNTKINAFSGTFQSFVNNLDNTFATDAQLSAASGVLQTGINTVATNLASTGAANLGRINILSGNVTIVASNLASTGSTLQTNINTVATNLASTGAANLGRINILSGNINTVATNLASTGAANLGRINILSGNINTVATNLASTGAANLGRINILSGNINTVSQNLTASIAGYSATLNSKIDSLSGTLTSEFVRKATQQQFIVTLPISVESTGITFPVAFASIPNSVQVTFEPSTDVGYMVAVKNRTTAGFTAEFSDVLFETGNKLNVFASI